MKYPFIRQHDRKDCGVVALAMICKYYGRKVKISQMRSDVCLDSNGVSILGITEAAYRYGLLASAVSGTSDELLSDIKEQKLRFPFIARVLNDEGLYHFVVVYEKKNQRFIYGNPSENRIKSILIADFLEIWAGQIITFTSDDSYINDSKIEFSLKKYLKLIMKYRRMMVSIILLTIVIILLELLGIIAIRNIFSARWNTSNMTKSVFYIIILLFANFFVKLINGGFSARYSKKIQKDILEIYYSILLRLPLEFFDINSTGELMSRFQDVQYVEGFLSQSILSLIIDSIMIAIYGFFACRINMVLAFFVLMLLIVLAFVSILYKDKNEEQVSKLKMYNAQVNATLKCDIDAIETIKSFQYENDKIIQMRGLIEKYTEIIKKNNILLNSKSVITSFLDMICVVFIIVYGSYLCHEGGLSVKDLFVFYFLTSLIAEPINRLVNLYTDLQSVVISAERADDIYDSINENQIHNGNKDYCEGDILIRNLNYAYGYGNKVLTDINIKFEKGNNYALVGCSGCGKTTAAKLLAGLREAKEGEIFIGCVDMTQIAIECIRKKIIYLSSKPDIFNDTVINNIQCGLNEISREDITNLCAYFGLDSFICNLPFGYDSMLEENGRNLSEGQKQKISIIRAILHRPSVIILDEATCCIDSYYEDKILNYLKDEKNITVIIISHNLRTVKPCSCIYVLDKGKLIEYGNHSELISNKGLYYSMLYGDG
ncbi:MAG: peptidase domain-containing ABC transporter [Eubacterium sp.]|nr:peptidase domain-containing ABC transporter [Eubacterium sp.]